VALWDERLPGESLKAWAAFTTYRDLPLADRSITAAWRSLTRRKRGDAPGRWDLWSRTFRWVERAAAYEVHLDALQRAVREKRLAELAHRRAEHEFAVQDKLEELEGWLRATVEKHNAAPITDIERTEDKEVIATESGELKVVTVKTRVKGIKTAGLARLSQEYRSTMQQAVVGVRGKAEDVKAAGERKTELPEFMQRALDEAQAKREARKKEKRDGADGPGKS
jgi:hypothetical protein